MCSVRRVIYVTLMWYEIIGVRIEETLKVNCSLIIFLDAIPTSEMNFNWSLEDWGLFLQA
jgi:hypothetical protein